MEKIVIDNVLEAIHYALKHNEFEFTEKQIKRADEYIISFIDDIDIDPKEFNIVMHGAPRLVYDKRINSILVRYFAFIEENIALYNELVEENYLFYEGHNMKYYALDKTLTSKFKRNEYKRLLLKDEDAINAFYSSLRGLDREEKEKYSKDFSDIIHIDHTTLSVGKGSGENISNYHFLIKRNIEFFGKEFLLGLNKRQREVLNNICFNISYEDSIKIKELFTKYPEYNGSIPLSSEILNTFSLDEINSMSIKDYELYKVALNNGLVDRIREILSLDSSFNCPKAFIREEIFRVLDNSEIIGLSDDAKEKISKIEIPEIDNVLIMPFSKINRIVLLDKANKKIDSIKNSHGK